MSGDDNDGFPRTWVFWTLEESADRLRVNIRTLFQYICQGKIKMRHHGGRFRITDHELQAFIEQREKNLLKRGRPRKVTLNRRKI